MRPIAGIRLRVAATVVLAGVVACHSIRAPDAGSPSAILSPLEGRTQLVTVVTEDWDSFRAILRRYERSQGEWRAVSSPVQAVIGRAGYGWGRGLHGDGPPLGRKGPLKVEGDGKSPAGVFAVGDAYGYRASHPRVSLAYTQAIDVLRCVDDPESIHYNEIVSTAEVAVDWESAERMRREDDLYTMAIVVEHNTDTPRPRGGSCIFLHLWKGPDVGMSGCTAMSMAALEELATWLMPGAAAIVALPEGEYRDLERTWGLPTQISH